MFNFILQKNKIFIAPALLLGLVVFNFNIGTANAYFSDSAEISGNTFTAGTLDISTSPDLGSVDLGTSQNYLVTNQGSLPFEYEMTALISGGSDTTFCGQLNIVISKGADILYTGSLSGLDFTKLIGGAQDNLTFTITDSHSNPAGKVCSFNLIPKAWQVGLDYSQGFTDTISTKAVVYSAGTIIPSVSSGVVLNEFLPNPNGLEYGFDFGADGDSMPKGEWIELYNNSNASVDLTGWYIKDLADHTINITSTNTQPATVIILAHKWLVVYMNGEILNNSGPETITLYNNLNISQDSYSYNGGTYCDMQPTPGDNNDTNPSGHCSGVPGNKSYARIPDGVGAWVDPIPTPGEKNTGSNDKEDMVKYYAKACFDKHGNILCDKAFLKELGLLEPVAEPTVIEPVLAQPSTDPASEPVAPVTPTDASALKTDEPVAETVVDTAPKEVSTPLVESVPPVETTTEIINNEEPSPSVPEEIVKPKDVVAPEVKETPADKPVVKESKAEEIKVVKEDSKDEKKDDGEKGKEVSSGKVDDHASNSSSEPSETTV